MTGQELNDALALRLRELFRGYTLLNKAGVLQEIKIFSQYVPQPAAITVNDRNNTGLKNYASSDYEGNFPCIIIQNKESKYLEERMLNQAVHTIRLLIGIYDDKPDCQGWRDIANVEDRLLNTLFVERVIAQKFRLEMPVEFKFLDVDTWPVYFGELMLNFTIGRRAMRKDYIHELGGE